MLLMFVVLKWIISHKAPPTRVLPSIFLTSARSLSNKMDKLELIIEAHEGSLTHQRCTVGMTLLLAE